MVSQNGEAEVAQRPGAGRGEQRVGEDSAGQGHGVQAVLLTRQDASAAHEGGHRLVEACRDDTRRGTRAHILDHRRKYGRGVGDQ